MARHSVDVHVGKRIRYQRWATGITQKQLATSIGIKFQQVQKYETGANRVSASRLWDISEALSVPISFFFEGLKAGETGQAEADRSGGVLADKKALELVQFYYNLPERQKLSLFNLVRELSEGDRLES